MKKTVFITIVSTLLLVSVNAQDVAFQDSYFKNSCVNDNSININGDTEIQISEAQAFSGTLYLPYNSVNSIGLEEFTAITGFICNNNSNLSSLNFTSNTALQSIDIGGCYYITGIDVLSNTALVTLYAQDCSISDLDLSQNSFLASLNVYNNNLSTLNVKNGNNSNMGSIYFNVLSNPLNCIDVDNVNYSNTNWLNKPSSAYFSLNCNAVLVNSITVQGQGGSSAITTQGGTLQMEAIVLPANADDMTYTWSVNNANATISVTGVLTAVTNGIVIVTATANDGSGVTGTTTITISNQTVGINGASVLSKVTEIYPNPTTGSLTIKTNETISQIEVLTITGKTVMIINSTNKLNISVLENGVYFIRIKFNDQEILTKRIMKV